MINFLLYGIIWYLVFGVITIILVARNDLKAGNVENKPLIVFKNAIKILLLWFPVLIREAL